MAGGTGLGVQLSISMNPYTIRILPMRFCMTLGIAPGLKMDKLLHQDLIKDGLSTFPFCPDEPLNVMQGAL